MEETWIPFWVVCKFQDHVWNFYQLEIEARFQPSFPSHPWNCLERLLCFGNKELPSPSSLKQQRFLSFSHQCPPAGGFAPHQPHWRPTLMKHPVWNILVILAAAVLEGQAAATKCSSSKVTCVPMRMTHIFKKIVSGPNQPQGGKQGHPTLCSEAE